MSIDTPTVEEPAGTPAGPFLPLHPACRGLRPRELSRIAEAATLRSFDTDEVVVPECRPPGLWLVLTGRLRLVAAEEDGDAAGKVIGFRGAGGQYGMLQLIHDRDVDVRVVADEPCRLIHLPQDAARKLTRRVPTFGKNLLQIASAGATELSATSKRFKQPDTVALVHAGDASRHVGRRIIRRLMSLGETVGVVTDEPAGRDDIVDRYDRVMRLAPPGDADGRSDRGGRVSDAIRDRIASWADGDRTVLDLEISMTDASRHHLVELIASVEAVYFIVHESDCSTAVQRVRELVRSTPAWKRKLFWVWVIDGGHFVAPYAEGLGGATSRTFKVHVGETEPGGDDGRTGWRESDDAKAIAMTRRLDVGVERIVHHLRGIQIGLALGGGAARGMSHLGVLRTLEQCGVVVDMIAGCSVGAMLGATYAAGYDPDVALDRFTDDLQLRGPFRYLGGKLFMLMKYRTGGWDPMLRRYLHDWRLEQLPIPVQTMAADLVSGEEVVRSTGDVVDAVLESINLPYLSAPINRDGRTLIDGGYLNVLPADALVRRGANYVISVDVSSRIRSSFVGNQAGMETGQMRTPWVWQVAARLREVQERNLSRLGGRSADLTIAPEVAEVPIEAFGDSPRTALLGEKAARRSAGSLRRNLRRLDPALFASVSDD